MTKLSVVIAVGVSAATFVALAGCSKPSGQSSSDQSASSAPPAAATPAPAPDATPAPAATPAADTGDYGTATQPGPGKIKLDIKVSSGDIYGDPTSGKEIFNQCMTCHSKDPGVNKVGPSLHGIINRHSGSIPGFNYSSANKSSGLVWSEQELYTYLQDPQKTVPGTYMTFTGVKDPQKRADVIAFLQENTK
jgi:cytochrome c